MLIFWKARLAFLAVPKTGSTAYEAALGPHASIIVNAPPELRHAPLYRYNRFFRPMFEKPLKTQMDTMAVMREPLDWLGSWYRYRQRSELLGMPNSTRGVSFDEFVLAQLEETVPSFANVGSQYRFLEARANGCKIDHLFRYDQQSKINNFLEMRLGVALQLPVMNVSPDITLELSESVAAHYRRARAEEFALYDNIGAY